jgi:hypothetical protein
MNKFLSTEWLFMHQFLVPHARPSCLPVPADAAPETKSTERVGRSARPGRAMDGPDGPVVPPDIACRIVRHLVLEMTALASDRPLWRRDGRRSTSHVRQVAMYICHVVLSLSLSDIGTAFGRDRTTVGHACNRVEDRRDDASFDAFVASIERAVLAVFGPSGIGSHA